MHAGRQLFPFALGWCDPFRLLSYDVLTTATGNNSSKSISKITSINCSASRVGLGRLGSANESDALICLERARQRHRLRG